MQQRGRVCCNSYRPRLFIVAGTYLFIFRDEHSSKPEGQPINVRLLTFEAAPDGEGQGLGQDADGTAAAATAVEFTLESPYRHRSITARAPSREARSAWLRALGSEKALAEGVRQGHAGISAKHKAAYVAGLVGSKGLDAQVAVLSADGETAGMT